MTLLYPRGGNNSLSQESATDEQPSDLALHDTGSAPGSAPNLPDTEGKKKSPYEGKVKAAGNPVTSPTPPDALEDDFEALTIRFAALKRK